MSPDLPELWVGPGFCLAVSCCQGDPGRTASGVRICDLAVCHSSVTVCWGCEPGVPLAELHFSDLDARVAWKLPCPVPGRTCPWAFWEHPGKLELDAAELGFWPREARGSLCTSRVDAVVRVGLIKQRVGNSVRTPKGPSLERTWVPGSAT